MPYRGAWLFVGLLCVAVVRADETKAGKPDSSLVEGTLTAQGSPVASARVFFGPTDQGLTLFEAPATDERGRFQLDLSKLPGPESPARLLILAPGFKLVDQTIKRGTSANFELAAEAWKETELRLQDHTGRPVGGVEVTVTLAGNPSIVWKQLKSDAEGRCRLAMARGMPVGLSARPEGARSIETYLGVEEDEPASISLPVLPPIHGQVVDAEGRPVAGVFVGSGINFGPEGKGDMLPLLFMRNGPAVTDREGIFSVAPRLYSHNARDLTKTTAGKTQLLCFADPSFRQLAYRSFDPTLVIEPMRVVLEPTRHVRIPIKRNALDPLGRGNFYTAISIERTPYLPQLAFPLISRSRPKSGQEEAVILEEDLPAGTYELEVRLIDQVSDPAATKELGKARQTLVVPKGDGPLELPPLELQPPKFEQMAGKPAPELAATDLETGKAVTLEEFRGKVVLLDFWGYWCGPCNINMPRLAELHRKYAGRPLAIVAIHDQSVQSRAQYDRKVSFARERLWGGRDLPFRVVLDRPDPNKPDDVVPEATGTTIRRYGIRTFPTLFVIDTDGTLVEQVPFYQHDRLETLVRQLVEKAEAR